MLSTSIKRIIALVGACALALTLVACTATNDSANEAQKANRAYMSQVNETMNNLSTALQSFVDAVSRDDLVNMRAQADNAYKLLDKLEAIEAPDELVDIKTQYLEGTSHLKEALNRYIELYTDAKTSSSFDWPTYDTRLAEIQALYDEGIEALAKGDAAAAAKN